MEEMHRNQEQIMEVIRPLRQSSHSYRRRKECIKKKTMELATLCGIDACTIIYEPDGKVDSWPENSSEVKAIIKNFFKHLTGDTLRKTTIRDESLKRVSGLPEVELWLENSRPAKRARIEDNAADVNDMINKIVPYLRNSSLTQLQKEELLKRLDCELQALTNRIEFLTKEKQYTANSRSENKRCSGSSEKTSRILFDLNCPPPLDEYELPLEEKENVCSALVPVEHGPLPDEDESSDLVPEQHKGVPVNYCLAVHCSNSSGTTTTSTSVSDS